MRTTLISIAFAISGIPLGAQQSTTPPADDQSVYAMFFNFHHNISLAVDAKKAKNSAAGAQFENGVAHLLRVRQDELAKVRVVSDRFISDLAKWQDDLKKYIDQTRSQKKAPDPANLAQFDQRKQRLFMVALAQLGNTLSPTSWAALHSYINDDYRLHISQVKLH